VDETAVVASWMDGGNKMVKLLDGQVFKVVQTVDIPAPPAEAGGKIKFKSSDGVEFEMDRVAARKSPTIMFLVKSSRTGSIPIVEVKSMILDKVLDYCYKHVPRAAAAAAAASTEASAEELNSWDADFVKVDLDTLYHLIMVRRLQHSNPARLLPLLAYFTIYIKLLLAFVLVATVCASS
jgi:hypothetical protein